jgi:hypothetical protein
MERLMDNQKLYEELGHIWRHFASWREKIFGGYLAVLIALGAGFSQTTSVRIRAAIFAGAIVVSIVFWILDFRSSQLLNACQTAAASLEEQKGSYGTLCSLRFGPRTWPTYGLAIDLLVAGVVGASGGGMFLYVARLWKAEIGIFSLCVAAVTALLLAWALQRLRSRQWLTEKESAQTKGSASEVRPVPGAE